MILLFSVVIFIRDGDKQFTVAQFTLVLLYHKMYILKNSASTCQLWAYLSVEENIFHMASILNHWTLGINNTCVIITYS